MNPNAHRPLRRYGGVLRGVRLPWLLILFSFFCSVVMMLLELRVATLTADIIDASQKAINGQKLLPYVVMTALTAVFTILNNYFTRKMEETITLRVRAKLWRRIMRLPTRYYDEDNGDELVSRVTSDAEAPASLFSMAVSFVTCVVTSVRGFAGLFEKNAMLARYSLLILPLTLGVCVLYGKLMFRLGVYSTVTTAESLGYLAERVRNFRLIKSAVAERAEGQRGDGAFRRMYRADFLSWLMVAGYQLASGIFSIFFLFLVFVVGGRLVPKGILTVGDLTSFYLISGIVSLQLMQFFMNVGSVSGTFGTMKKIAEILDTPTECDAGESAPPVRGELSLERVCFAYGDGPDVLRDLSLRIPAGKVTAVLGGNGAGKSTLFKLLARLYEPRSGEIRLDGRRISEFSLPQWRSRFAYVFQRDPLIGGTVRENLTYGLDRPVSDEELAAVTKQANCYECIMEKPNGFDEDVGQDGSSFSGGQGQCIAIARAMLRNADCLLLDEATGSLDATSQARVTEALERLTKGRTTLMIAHSYAATRCADHIVVMKDGAVEAAGTPDELRKTSEFYRLFAKTL